MFSQESINYIMQLGLNLDPTLYRDALVLAGLGSEEIAKTPSTSTIIERLQTDIAMVRQIPPSGISCCTFRSK